MPEKRRKFDPEFREGAVRIVRETGSRSRRSLAILGSTRARWATGSPRTRAEREGADGLSPRRSTELKRLRGRGRRAADGA